MIKKKNKNTEYDVPNYVKAAIDKELSKYAEFIDRNGRLSEEPYVTNNDDALGTTYGLTPNYSAIRTSTTNSVSRRTENIVIGNVERWRDYLDAESNKAAIDMGLRRAAETAERNSDFANILSSLRNGMIYGEPIHRLTISKDTMTKYRRRAYYFIAIELNYIEPKQETGKK